MKGHLKEFLNAIYKISFPRAFLICLIFQLFIIVYILTSISDFQNFKSIMLRTQNFFKKELSIEFVQMEKFNFVNGTLSFIYRNFQRDFQKITSKKPLRKSQLKTFYITVKKEELNDLNSNLPQSGKENYIKGYLKIDNSEIQKIKLRYRGDTPTHWAFEKKSLRIKISNDKLFNMSKTFNLINPPYSFSLIDIVNYEISKKLGLIAPDIFPVRVFINGQFMGVYFYLSQVDESLLRKHKVMPGSIYYGDGCKTPPNVNYKTTTLLWEDPSTWTKQSSRNAEQKNNRDDINFFINAINKFDDIEFYNFVNDYLDKDKYYKYFAFDVITGTAHHDYHHNHKVYFDPYKGKFEPIQWDIRWWIDSKSKDLSYYELLKRVKLNPILENERDKISYNILCQNIVKSMLDKLDFYKKLVTPDLATDIYRTNSTNLLVPWISLHFSMTKFEKSIKNTRNNLISREKYLYNLYNTVKTRYLIKEKGEYSQILFEVEGNSGIEINLEQLGSFIYRDINFNGMLDSSDVLVNKAEKLYPGRKQVEGDALTGKKFNFYKRHRLQDHPLYYSYIVKEGAEKGTKLKAKNIVTGRDLRVKYEEFEPNKIKADSVHPWKLPNYQTKEIVLQGNIEVKKTLEFDKYTNVKILPGTTFVMNPKQSVFFYGKVIAQGTKDRPIKFIAKDKLKPWGSVVVQGQDASGSKFKYVEFSNGSVDERRLVQYTAQFNIHDLKDFEVSNIKVGKNFVGDDAMHISYSNGILKDSVFVNARMDALDVDIADVKIENCIFINSGNDSADLMTSKAIVENCIFINSGDKGISTGEWTNGIYKNNIFYKPHIGLEVKDKSKVTVENAIIINAKEKAINLYNKNLRYDEGGHLFSDIIYIIGNDKITADKRSSCNTKQIKKALGKLILYTAFKNFFINSLI